MTTALMLALCGCGGGKDSPDALSGEYGGVWSAKYNMSVDDCQIVEGGVLGFTDSQVINQDGDQVSLETLVGGLPDPLLGTLQPNQSFTVSSTFVGDFYGDGTVCEVTQTIAYNPRTDTEAASTFQREINCDDGFACTSSALGVATRAQS